MAAFKELLQPECGGQNALMRLTNAVTTDKGVQGSIGHDRLSELARHGDQQAIEEQLVAEFLGEGHAINSFEMSTLLDQIQHVDQGQHWAESFTKEQALSHSWAEEFMKDHPTAVGPISSGDQLQVGDQWAREFVEKSSTERQWADEFVSQCSTSKDEVVAAAKDLVSSVQDPTLEGTQFMSFVKKLSTGQTSILDGQVLKQDPENLAKEWAKEFQQDAVKLQEELEFWDRMQKAWESGISDQDDWASEYLHKKQEYEFAQENPYQNTEDAFQKGLEKLKEGDLPSAILYFEAAVQADPTAVRAWQYLGTCQADNEQELFAIAALEKCLELEPSNLTALMSLAVSYTNEARSGEACGMLRRWLQANPEYSHLAPQEATPTYTPSFADPHMYKELSHAYIAAAQQLPDQLDPQVQVGLGILFNLTREFDKAVDCFRAALATNSRDAMLWNKLGATLANGNHSEEAIHAYHEALKLRPDFVRARYNLGISCINLKAHREAVEHFVTALHFQRSASMGATAKEKGSMSDAIWSTLRLALIYLNKQDLLHTINDKDLDTLMKHFNIEQ